MGRFFSFWRWTIKKSTKMASRSPSPEPHGASQEFPGRATTAQRGAKRGPRAAKRGLGGLPPKRSPEASRTPFWHPRGSIFDPPGGDSFRPPPLHLQPSGKHFRLLLGLSRARPQKPKKQKRDSFWKVCGNGLTHKRVVGGVGGDIVNPPTTACGGTSVLETVQPSSCLA